MRTIRFEGAKLYPKQEAAIHDPARIATIEASTKAGKTVGCLAWIIEQALKGEQGQNYWWIAPVYSQAEIAFRRCWNYLTPIKAMCKRNQSSMHIFMPNGTRIWFKSGERSDDLYGEDVYAAVLDEASRMREESWIAIRSTLTYTRGPVRIIGNVRGRKNWFYRLARLAESGEETDLAYHRITAWDAVQAGVLDREEIDSAYRDFVRLGQEDVFRQLYMAEAVDDAANPFGLQAINAIFKLKDYSKATSISAGVDLAGRGAVNIERVGDAESRDWTAIVMLDKQGNCTHLSRFRKPHYETTQIVVETVGRTMALVDSTGAGDSTVENLQRRGDMRVLGFTFTVRSRQDLLEGLAIAIQEGSLALPNIPTFDGRGRIKEELESFEFRYTPQGVRYEVPEGLNDDLTMALALAVKRMPIRRRAKMKPVAFSPTHGSRWEAAGDEYDAWKKYQESKKPTLSPEEEKPKHDTAMPVVTTTGTGTRWGQAG